MCICIYVYTYVCMYVYLYFIYICVYMYICVHVCMYVYVYIYIYIYIYVYVYIYIYIYTYIYINKCCLAFRSHGLGCVSREAVDVHHPTERVARPGEFHPDCCAEYGGTLWILLPLLLYKETTKHPFPLLSEDTISSTSTCSRVQGLGVEIY